MHHYGNGLPRYLAARATCDREGNPIEVGKAKLWPYLVEAGVLGFAGFVVLTFWRVF